MHSIFFHSNIAAVYKTGFSSFASDHLKRKSIIINSIKVFVFMQSASVIKNMQSVSSAALGTFIV